mgnify:FL=1|jgi:membrane protein DedA with SNARE-associated domain
MRNVFTVAFEALVVGLVLLVLLMLTKMLPIPAEAAVVLAGALTHVVFEYLGLNRWWCLVTY